MRRPRHRSFLDLDEAELANRADEAAIPPSYRVGVLENLRTLQAHARRVRDALAADPHAPDTAPSRVFEP